MQPAIIHPHLVFEALAYFTGFQLFLRQRRQHRADSILPHSDDGLWLAAGAILGAAIGSRLIAWLQDPVSSFANFPDFLALMQGKTVVGGFLGGLVGVEISKKLTAITSSTGDLFAVPCLAGLITGRIGCFVSGLEDRTHGVPTTLVWGYDYGDGIARHPTQLYEILFALVLWIIILRIRVSFIRSGDQFRFFMIAYLLFRLVIDFIKPAPFQYPGGLSGIQITCLAGLVYYANDARRIGTALPWPGK